MVPLCTRIGGVPMWHKYFVAAVCIVLLAGSAYGQDDNDRARLYRSQFSVQHQRTKEIARSAEELVRAAPTDASIPHLRQEIHEIGIRVGRLREETTNANMDELKRGELSSKTFLLVSSACNQISFVLQAIDQFLETRDPDFLQLARHGGKIAEIVEELLSQEEEQDSKLTPAPAEMEQDSAP